ncbi:MAG: hypothetical protein Q4D05_02845 [Acinetobacter sp.]|nr:hypothetical protein [Acinetobacter sp.]
MKKLLLCTALGLAMLLPSTGYTNNTQTVDWTPYLEPLKHSCDFSKIDKAVYGIVRYSEYAEYASMREDWNGGIWRTIPEEQRNEKYKPTQQELQQFKVPDELIPSIAYIEGGIVIGLKNAIAFGLPIRGIVYFYTPQGIGVEVYFTDNRFLKLLPEFYVQSEFNGKKVYAHEQMNNSNILVDWFDSTEIAYTEHGEQKTKWETKHIKQLTIPENKMRLALSIQDQEGNDWNKKYQPIAQYLPIQKRKQASFNDELQGVERDYHKKHDWIIYRSTGNGWVKKGSKFRIHGEFSVDKKTKSLNCTLLMPYGGEI